MHARIAVARRELPPRALRIAIAAKVARWISRASKSGRPDFAVIAQAPAGEDCSREVAAAREHIAAYQRDDSRPVAAIPRRPVVLLADELWGAPA
ncbi:MAG: hypothetical protein QOI71_2828 [Gaiellales bacterium]|jgi:hypothetical protein|nr:hypothetical protein [Gaiellales bacterium]